MNYLTKLGLIAFFLTLGFTACKKDNDTAPIYSSVINVANSVTKGKWHITNFSENGTDNTTELKDYVFKFTDSKIFAVKATEQDTGVWSSKLDNRQLIVVIDFGISPHVSELI